MENQTIETSVSLFLASSRTDIISAREALLSGSAERLEEILEKIKSSAVVQSIVATASSSSQYLEGIIDKVNAALPGVEVIRGLTIVAAGAAVWGISSVLAPIVAVFLIAYGISVAVPNAKELIANKFESLISM